MKMGVAKLAFGLLVIVFALSTIEGMVNKCFLRPQTGPCRANLRRWYYNPSTRKCVKFRYGGCKGNGNRFKSKIACQRRCRKSICNLPIVAGPCKARIQSWGYDKTKNKCEEFFYGGCRGNPNRFSTQASCDNVCLDICRLPKQPGPCRGSIEQWYYNSKKRRCLKFFYGGCKGNDNRFDSRAKCMKRCP